jgi:hypothetical protein
MQRTPQINTGQGFSKPLTQLRSRHNQRERASTQHSALEGGFPTFNHRRERSDEAEMKT